MLLILNTVKYLGAWHSSSKFVEHSGMEKATLSKYFYRMKLASIDGPLLIK